MKPRPGIILCSAAALCLAFLLAFPIVNPDLFLHLSVSRQILATGAAPRADALSWTRAGAPFIDYEWGSQLLYRGAFAAAGLAGVFLLKSLVMLAAAAVFAATLALYAIPRPGRILAAAAWAGAMLPVAGAKPEQFSLLAFSLVFFLVERRRLTGAALPWWTVAPLFAVWANLHPGFLFGLMVLALGGAGAGACVAAAAGTLLQPYGPKVYDAIFRHASDLNALKQIIWEWAPPNPRNPWYWPFFLIVAAGLAAALRRGKRLEPGLALLWLALAAAGISSGRFTAYLAVAGLPLALHWAGEAPFLSMPSWRLAACACLLAVHAAMTGAAYGSFRRLFNDAFVPSGAAAFLSDHAGEYKDLRLYNPVGWGGYLSWTLSPAGFRTFEDGRYALFYDLIQEERRASQSPAAWEAFLRKYGVDLAVVEWPRAALMNRGAWVPLYQDEKSILLVRRPL